MAEFPSFVAIDDYDSMAVMVLVAALGLDLVVHSPRIRIQLARWQERWLVPLSWWWAD